MPNRLTKLREHVSDHHDALEETPTARQLQSGEISKERYIRLHGQLYHVHRHLDAAYLNTPELDPFWSPEDLRSSVLEQDLEALGLEETPAPIAPTRDICEQIPGWHEPWTGAIGTLYVVKGGRFGSRMLIGSVSEALDRPAEIGRGMDYYLRGMDVLPRQWRSFIDELNGISLRQAEEERLFAGARALFEGLLGIYREVGS